MVRKAVASSIGIWVVVGAVAAWGAPVLLAVSMIVTGYALWRMDAALNVIDHYDIAGDEAATWAKLAFVSGMVLALTVCAL